MSSQALAEALAEVARLCDQVATQRKAIQALSEENKRLHRLLKERGEDRRKGRYPI